MWYGWPGHIFSGFSWEPAYTHYPIARGLSVLSGSTGQVDLPACPLSTPFNLLFRQEATLSLLRLHFSDRASIGILTDSVIGLALRLTLSPRLTLIRLALIRNPESFGEGVSHPLYRYLYLHLLFRTLHQSSRFGFKAERNAPLPLIHSFGTDLIPVYSPCLISRLVSCYALFK